MSTLHTGREPVATLSLVGALPQWNAGLLVALQSLARAAPDSGPLIIDCGTHRSIDVLERLLDSAAFPLFSDLPLSSHLSLGLRSVGKGYAIASWLQTPPPYGEAVTLDEGHLWAK